MTKLARKEFQDYLANTLAVPYEASEKFDAYYEKLIKWQRQINLISGNDDIWARHFLDSVQLANFIDDKKSSIIDFGSGAGFPGLPLAIIGYKNISLVESDKKKAIFLKEIIRLFNLDVKIYNERIESMAPHSCDYITSRACASLNKLLEYSFPSVSHGTTCLFLKGKKHAMELEESKTNWRFDCKITPSITSDEGVILSISNLKPKSNA